MHHFSCFPSLLQQQFAQQEVTQIVGSKTHFVASPQNTGNPRNPAENLEISGPCGDAFYESLEDGDIVTPSLWWEISMFFAR